MTSIRKFLITIILSVVCLSNFIAAFHGYQDSLGAIDHIEERQLEDKARTLNSLVSHHVAIPENLFDEATLYQVWHSASLLAKSKNAPEFPLYLSDSGLHISSFAGNQWLLSRFKSDEAEYLIIVGIKRRLDSSLTEEVIIRTILPIIWVLPIIGGLVWAIVYIGLKPLSRLAAKLESRHANDFSALTSDHYTQELLPIIDAMNGLFGRLNNSFQREKRFSADAAHELRTPLSALKVNLHNLSKENNDNETFQSLKRTADRMEHSIEQLLALHKVSIESENYSFEKVNICEAVQELIADVYDQLDFKRQEIELKGSDLFVSARPESIAILLRNLVDNASKYTPEGGVIQVTINRQDDRVCLTIEDSGPGIPENEYARVLDRFYRVGGDHNKSNIRGSGLGLSIVSDIARSHNATIVLSKSLGLGGLAVKISFPMLKGEEYG